MGALEYIEDVAVALFRAFKDIDLFDGLNSKIPDGGVWVIDKVFRTRLKDVVVAFHPCLLGKRVGGEHFVPCVFSDREVLLNRLHVRIAGYEELPYRIRNLLA
jgi:hypothetical protein